MESMLLALTGLVYLVLSVVAMLLTIKRFHECSVVFRVAGACAPLIVFALDPIKWRSLRTVAIFHAVAWVGVLLSCILYLRANPMHFEGGVLGELRNLVAPAFAEPPFNRRENDCSYDQSIFGSGEVPIATLNRAGRSAVTMDQVVLSRNVLRFSSANYPEDGHVLIDLGEAFAQDLEDGVADLGVDQSYEVLLHIVDYGFGSSMVKIDSHTDDFCIQLSISRVSPHRYKGKVLVDLHSGSEGGLTGSFTALDRNLASNMGEVNRSYNSSDTIEYIVRDYLEVNLSTKLTRVVGFNRTYFQASQSEPEASTEVTLELEGGNQVSIGLNLSKRYDVWTVDPIPVNDLLAALSMMNLAPPASTVLQRNQARAGSVAENRLDEMLGRNVVVTLADGRTWSGVLNALNGDTVSVLNPALGGDLNMLFSLADVREVEPKKL